MIWYVLLMCTYLFLLFSVLSLMLRMTPAGQLCIFLKSNHYMPRLLFSLYLVLHCSIVSNKKIMAVCNWSRANERSAPWREVPMTKELVTDLADNQGDIAATVLLNFFNTKK